MEEFRKAGDEKKRVEAETRKHRREVTRLRKIAKERQAEATKEIARLRREAEEAVDRLRESEQQASAELLAAEEAELVSQEMAVHWDGVFGRMLQREMEALGVLRGRDVESEIAWGDSEEVWSDAPVTDQVDLSALFGEVEPLSIWVSGSAGPSSDGVPSLGSAVSGSLAS